MSMYGKIRLTVDCSKDEIMVKQSDRDACDINKIVARFEKTGMVDHLTNKNPFYGDVSDIVDYQSALNTVMKADDLFMSMSPEIRARFENDPMKMISFVDDKRNLDEAIKLGMVIPKPLEKNATGAVSPPAPAGSGQPGPAV